MRKILNAVYYAGLYLCGFIYTPESTQMFMCIKKRLCWDWCTQFHVPGGQDEDWHSKGALKILRERFGRSLCEREWRAQMCVFTLALKQPLLNRKIAQMDCIRQMKEERGKSASNK